MSTPESVHKVQSNSEDRGIKGQDLPPQHHAGQVGYGPNYHPEPTIQEKIKGLREELEGKVKHDPELIRHGHGIRSGEEKRKKPTGEDEPNPFQSAKEDDSDKSPVRGSPSSCDTCTPKEDHESHKKSAKERVAIVVPEGTHESHAKEQAAEGIKDDERYQ